MEHPKFKFEQKVKLSDALVSKCNHTSGHIWKVYSPSQKKELGYDYLVVLPDGDYVDASEEDLSFS